MIFVDRLKESRNKCGISQEQLAEKLNISRQAVAKWESGTAMPDIDNLIEIGNIFQVSLDYLLRENIYSSKAIATECEYCEIACNLISFIAESKKNTYANFAAGKVEPSRLASTDLAYQSKDFKDFKYLDTYVGGSNFSGTEVVYFKDSPVWSMNYIGRLLSDEGTHTIDFLTKALANVDYSIPYRGPALFRNGKYVYTNSVSGEYDWFQGYEKIFYEDVQVYKLVYHGGIIK